MVNVTDEPFAVPLTGKVQHPPFPVPENTPDDLFIDVIVQVCEPAPPLPQQLQVPVRSCGVLADAGPAMPSRVHAKAAAVSTARKRIKALLPSRRS
ncbi:MAG TPA: hypothetical protein VIS95_09525 [Solirubrobacterales bacterium]